MLFFLFFSLLAYLLGSLSSAILICRFSGRPDPRSQGSKNPGASNVLRIAGKRYAAQVLLFDIVKGWLPVFLAKQLGMGMPFLGWIAFFAFLGHLYPVFFKFRGGKGVATALGGLLALAWPIAAVAMLSWLVMIVLFRIISLASITAAGVVFGYALYQLSFQNNLPILLMSVLLIIRHHPNIQRLFAGKETTITNKINKKNS